MTCYHPLKGYRSTELGPNGYGITFNAVKALNPHNPIPIPCGRCIGCRMDRSKEWAIRCMHESKMHAHNCFITLTYDQAHVPASYSLELRDWQLFMKRLRKHSSTKIRFYACGEYGPNGGRPHYHALIFGYDFPDKVLYRSNRSGDRIYKSKLLNELWGMSELNELGAVTFKSAAYCARYIMKKMAGNDERQHNHYHRQSPIDGNWYNVRPEFNVMSRRPGLGTAWFEKFKRDAFPSDFLIVDGRKVKPPAFYLNKLEDDEAKPIERARKRAAVKVKWNSTSERLKVREEIQSVRAKRLQRTLES